MNQDPASGLERPGLGAAPVGACLQANSRCNFANAGAPQSGISGSTKRARCSSDSCQPR